MARNKIGEDDWDYLLFGDGSGQTADGACGWACRLYRSDYTIKDFFGGYSHGTNITAELMAYVQPIHWLACVSGLPMGRVHVFSDCETIIKAGRGEYGRNSHRVYWASLQEIERLGWELDFHWIPRDTYRPNKWAHDKANELRRTAMDLRQ